RCGLLERYIVRLQNHRSLRLDTNVFSETSGPNPKDFVARLEFGDVPADGFHRSGKIRARAGILRFAKPKNQPANTAWQHPAVIKSQGNGANPDEDLVIVRSRLFDLFKFQNLIWWPIFTIPHRLH